MLKADLHIHSIYSKDSLSRPEAIIKRCLKTGINCIAIADHGTAEGAFKIQKMAPFKVIAAEEIKTDRGEIIGLFLKETIPDHIPAEEAIKQIRNQDGLVCVPHPFDRPNRSGLGGKALEEFADNIDIIEGFNSRSPLSRFSRSALKFAAKYNKPVSAGSDAHVIAEIGYTYIEMPEFNGKADFLEKLRKGKIHGHKTNLFIYPGTQIARIKKMIAPHRYTTD
jgi:predicted metal-dependent phosphoesterase TrpH